MSNYLNATLDGSRNDTGGLGKSSVGRNSQSDSHLKLALDTAEDDNLSSLYWCGVLSDLQSIVAFQQFDSTDAAI